MVFFVFLAGDLLGKSEEDTFCWILFQEQSTREVEIEDLDATAVLRNGKPGGTIGKLACYASVNGSFGFFGSKHFGTASWDSMDV